MEKKKKLSVPEEVLDTLNERDFWLVMEAFGKLSKHFEEDGLLNVLLKYDNEKYSKKVVDICDKHKESAHG